MQGDAAIAREEARKAALRAIMQAAIDGGMKLVKEERRRCVGSRRLRTWPDVTVASTPHHSPLSYMPLGTGP